MELSKRNLIIVGGIILALIFGIILLGRTPAPKPVTTNPSSGPDFNVVQPSEEVVVFNTPTPTLEPIPTLLPTETPAPTEYPTPTLEPTLTTIPIQTPTQTPTVYSPTRKPTKTPTKTPTPDTSIKATGVSLSLTQLTLEINKTFQVLSKVEPDNTTDKSVYWSSRDAHIAIVDTNGNITGKSLGNTIITARTSNWKTTAVSVTVVNKPQPTSTIRVTPTTVLNQIYPESISLDNTSLSLKSSDTKQLKVTIKPQNTNQRSIKWSSSNGQVATVNVSGKVTAKNQGTANITVKTINGKKAVSKITVVGNQVVTPTLISNPPTKTPTTTTVPNPPTNTPTTTIVPNTPTKTPTKTPTNTPTPTQIIINPSSLSLTPSDINLYLGDSLQITAKVKPDNAPNKTVNWSSSNANIASVSVSGKVTTKTTGTANIIAKTINNITATTKITVLSNPVTPTSTKTPTPTRKPTPTPTKKPTYKLVWSDEFSGTSLDTSKWTAVASCGDHWNNEQQCYTADAVSVSGGNLVIKSDRKKVGSFNFTSGLVKSDGSTFINGNIKSGVSKYTVKYGRIEIRAQLPTGGQGIWPALWMIPPPYSNPPELEIVEAFSDTSTIYTNYWYNESGTMKQAPVSYKISSPSTSFHIFAVEWEPGVLRWYADGVLKRTFASSVVTDTPMFIIMNTALGGKGTGPVASTTSFPQYFLIDYVRVYQKR